MFNPLVSVSLGIVAAYLIGSLSFGVIISRLFGLSDPRTYGSNNPGATNVLRSGHKSAAALTLFLDGFKGWLPVALATHWLGTLSWPPSAPILLGLAAFIGHLWPIFFRFQGGKGVATAAGILLGLQPALGASIGGIWLAVAILTRYSSLAALLAALSAPILAYTVFSLSPADIAGVSWMSGLLIWKHKPNISKLLAGQESKIGQKSSVPPTA